MNMNMNRVNIGMVMLGLMLAGGLTTYLLTRESVPTEGWLVAGLIILLLIGWPLMMLTTWSAELKDLKVPVQELESDNS